MLGEALVYRALLGRHVFFQRTACVAASRQENGAREHTKTHCSQFHEHAPSIGYSIRFAQATSKIRVLVHQLEARGHETFGNKKEPGARVDRILCACSIVVGVRTTKMTTFSAKSAIVIGGGTGVGRALVLALSADGAKVW